jgi:hypothetical protein
VRKLERRLGSEPATEWCPTCGSKIVFVEALADGTEVWTDGKGPCPTCDNKPPNGGVGKIVVVRPARYESA